MSLTFIRPNRSPLFPSFDSFKAPKMTVAEFIAKFKSLQAIIVIVTVGSLIAFVVTFVKNVKEICTWTSMGGPEVSPSPLAQIAIGQDRAFVEQSTLLGPPKYRFARSINPEVDASFELESDERELGSDMFDALADKKFVDAKHYYAAKYEFATYSKGQVNYVLRYRRSDERVSGIFLESSNSSTNCTNDDLRKLPETSDFFAFSRPICIGKATFGDLFPKASGPIRTPFRYSSTKCWGELRKGGASGHNSGVEITCHFLRETQAQPDLNYLIKIGARAVGFSDIDDSFSEIEDPPSGKFEDFIDKAKFYLVHYVILFDPHLSR